MSIASNASQLENPGDYLVAGIVSVINGDAGRSPFEAFGPRMPEKMPKNRVEVKAGGFARGSDHMSQSPADGSWFYDHKRGSVQMTVVSQRQTKPNTGPDSSHAVAVGRCRWLVTRNAQKLVPNVVGGLQIMDIIDQGDTYTASETFDSDRTELRFQVDIFVPAANYSDS